MVPKATIFEKSSLLKFVLLFLSFDDRVENGVVTGVCELFVRMEDDHLVHKIRAEHVLIKQQSRVSL